MTPAYRPKGLSSYEYALARNEAELASFRRVRLLMIQNFLNIIWAICGRKDTDLKKSVTW